MRAAIEDRLGAPIRVATDQPSGFSPGVAVRLELEGGRKAFIKAVHPSANPSSPGVHRREAIVLNAMPASAPVAHLLWVIDEGTEGWVVLALEHIEGTQPEVPWQPTELDRVLSAMDDLATALTPTPIPRALVGDAVDIFAPATDGWASVAGDSPNGLDDWSLRHLERLATLEAGIAEATRGETLVHLDIRADNLLLTADGVRIVDWPHARVGQPFVDLVWFAPSVSMQGGPDPQDLLARYPAARGVDPEAIDSLIAAVAGYFTIDALRPDPPGLPTLRAFQAAQGVVARRWLADRRGWR